MVSSTPRPHFTPGKDPVPIVQEAGYGLRAGLDGRGKSRPHRDSIPDRPARSLVAIPTELPGPHKILLHTINDKEFYCKKVVKIHMQRSFGHKLFSSAQIFFTDIFLVVTRV